MFIVRACIHCISNTGGKKTPRPLGPALHGTSVNFLLQFDYIDVGPGNDGSSYILVLLDDHSGYCCFFAIPSAAAVFAAQAIFDWCAAFGIHICLVSDDPTHFKNEAVEAVCKGLKVSHHFIVPYCPWSNGGIERLGNILIRIFRSILSDCQLSHEDWPDLHCGSKL